MLTPQQMEDLGRTYETEGYLTLPKVVSAERLGKLRDALFNEFSRVKDSGQLFSGGGTISGHLNCFPGAESRFVYDTLVDAGIIELLKRIHPQAVRMPNVGCNMNLPGSSAQNFHIDGYASTAFVIVNVAVVDTVVENGAMEYTPRSHTRDYKYWEFATSRLRSQRAIMSAGDVMIRPSTLWHRGMPNRTKVIRPMIGLSWEEGGSKLDDPYSFNEGKIGFFPNRYALNLAGKLREHAFASFPSLGSGYLFVRSMLQS